MDRHAHDPDAPAGRERAVADGRLAERARYVRSLRVRAAGAAVAVFLVVWLLIYLPARQDDDPVTTTPAVSAPAVIPAEEDVDTSSDPGDAWPADPSGDTQAVDPETPIPSGQS